MTSNFFSELNKNVFESIRQNTAFFIQPVETYPPIVSNSLSGLPITGANYVNLMLANNLNGTRHTEYVNMNEALSAKPEWFSTLSIGNRPRGALYQEESAAFQPRYSFVLPTAELNQNMYQDIRNNARPRDNYIPFQSNNTTMNDFGSFVQEQFTNAINASFTNCAFKSNIPEQALEQFKKQLIGEITKNPNFMTEITNMAYQEVMDSHYLPFDRKIFIERVRNPDSNEFKQLNSDIANHVEDMYTNKKPSFNRDFNELSKTLIGNIENIHRTGSNSRTAVENEISNFVLEQLKQDKTASVLADTCAGTYLEKSQKIAKVGKIIISGAALAGALLTSNYPAAIGIAGTLISEIVPSVKVPEQQKTASNNKEPEQQEANNPQKTVKAPEQQKTAVNNQESGQQEMNKPKKTVKVPEQQKIVINNKEFKEHELKKILDFDNAPFNISGKGKIGKRDYELARLAEKTILAAVPSLNKDEYQREKTQQQVLDFCKTTVQKLGKVSGNDFQKVADTITTLQGLKGDNTLKNLRGDPRTFFSGLNKTIKDNPLLLEQAVSQVKTNTRQRAHTPAMIRK